MSRTLTLLVAAALVLSSSPAHAQRFRVTSSARPTVTKPVESNYSSSPRSTGGYAYSSDSGSYSSDDSRDSGVTFHMVCLVIILLSLAVRLIAGVIGFFAWIGRQASG